MGTPIGLRDVYYAKLISDGVGGVTYGTPVHIVGAITANINPNASQATQFGDDGPMDTMSTLGQIELELSVADLPAAVIADLLGHTVTSGLVSKKGGDVPNWVALGFRSLKSNGAYRYVWLVKGKFMEPEQKHETKGESINFQPPTINGRFVKREYDDEWQHYIDSDDPSYVAAIGTNWFASVDNTVTIDTVAPTVSSTTPTSGGSGIATNSTVKFVFDKSMMIEDLNINNFIVAKASDGAPVTCTLAVSQTTVANDTVTLSHAAAFGASTQYNAVCAAIRSVSGVRMTAPKVINFTTT